MAYYNESKVTYQQLVMEQIKIIQNICAKELKDGDKVLKNAMGEQIIEGEDTRHSFLQSVEILGSMLEPYFGTMEAATEFPKFCDSYDMELITALKDEDFIKEIKDMFDVTPEAVKKSEKLGTQINIYLLNEKIKYGRRIFRDLIKVFKANDFLGSQSYGEGSEEAIDSGSDAYINEEDDGKALE